MIEKKRIQIRRDLEENWVNNNPILLYGEIGFDLTNNKIKIGDGERPWNELSWVNEVNIDLSIFYTKEEIDTILNELNTNLSNDYYNKEQVDEIVSNIEVGGGSVGTTNYNELENRPTTNIQGLTYEQGYELMEYINNNRELPYPLSLQGIYLNDCRLGTVEPNFIEINIDGLNSRQVRLWLNTDEQSFGVDYLDWISSTDVFDIRLLPLQKRDEFFNYLISNLSFPENTTVVVSGIILNGLEISNPYEDNESVEIYFKYYGHPKSYDIRLIYLKENKFISYDLWEIENKELVTKEQVDELISNSGGGGGTTDLSDYYTKVETNTEIQKAIEVIDLYTADGNTLHEFITYLKDNPTTKLTDKIVTYRGKVCENFEIGSDSVSFYHNAFCFSEDKKDTDVSFTVVLMPNPAMPQLIVRNYIPDPTGVANVVPTTNQMNNLIDDNLNDLNERIQGLQDVIDGIEIPEQQEVSNATITIIQGDNNQSFNLNQPENQTIMLENKDFNWFGNETSFESLPDEQKVNGIYYISDKINYKDDITGHPYIVYKTSQLLNDKPFATTNDLPKEWFGTQEEFDLLENYETNTTYYIETTANSGGDVDLSNYYTKTETNTEIQNAIDSIEIPTTDLSNYYTKEQTYSKDETYSKTEIDEIVGLINNELEIIING